MAELSMDTRMVERTPVVDLIGEIDSYTAPRLKDKLTTLIDSGHPTVVINMTSVDFIDSTGLGTLVGGQKRASEQGGAIRIICPNEQIYKIFSITGLVRVFPIFDSESAAFAA